MASRTFIRISRVQEITALSRSSIYNKIGQTKYFDPAFPRPISLSNTGNGAVAWDLAEVEAWMDIRASSRTSPSS
mgnify:CR=1 FL=1